MRLLGIDPGSRITGYGVLQLNGTQPLYVASGLIKIQAKTLPEKLLEIFNSVSTVINSYQPEQAAIEEVFFARNVASALKLGQARAAAIVAAGAKECMMAEYTARQIKQAVVGYGNADKQQIQQMVMRLLQLSEPPPTDAADALAIALCHSQAITGQLGGYRRAGFRRGRIKHD